MLKKESCELCNKHVICFYSYELKTLFMNTNRFEYAKFIILIFLIALI